MISSKPLAAPGLDQKRSHALNQTSALEFGKSTKQHLPKASWGQSYEQRLLKQHVNQVIDQQISQITHTPIQTQQVQTDQAPSSALNTAHKDALLELIDLDNLPPHQPLALLDQHAGKALSTHDQAKPLALAEKPSSCDIQLLSEHSSAMLADPSQQLMSILQDLLQNTPQDNSFYWLENTPPTAATQVASKDTPTPNLAWQASLWF